MVVQVAQLRRAKWLSHVSYCVLQSELEDLELLYVKSHTWKPGGFTLLLMTARWHASLGGAKQIP